MDVIEKENYEEMEDKRVNVAIDQVPHMENLCVTMWRQSYQGRSRTFPSINVNVQVGNIDAIIVEGIYSITGGLYVPERTTIVCK